MGKKKVNTVFFFFRILSILTHRHKGRGEKVLKKLSVVYIKNGLNKWILRSIVMCENLTKVVILCLTKIVKLCLTKIVIQCECVTFLPIICECVTYFPWEYDDFTFDLVSYKY